MISIVIPTYKEEKLIGQTLSRLKAGLTLPYEIIVADDKSPDDTAQIAEKFADIVLHPAVKHGTIAENRNEGARAARGDILVFMDTDTRVLDPNAFFTRALETLESQPDIVAVTGAMRVLPEMETRADRIMYMIFNLIIMVKNNLLHMGEAQGKFQMIKRSAFEKISGYREDLVTREDADIFHRLAKIGKTVYDPKLLVYHTGRRAHRVGWPKLLTTWMIESVWFFLFDKSIAKEWKPVR